MPPKVDYNKLRQYFYHIDLQGKLFTLNGPSLRKLPTGPTYLKDSKFLEFFFKRLKDNKTGLFSKDFPFVSPCGPELNFVHVADKPIVFQELVFQENGEPHLTYATARMNQTDFLSLEFDPNRLFAGKETGRLYFKPKEKIVGNYGLIRSQLCVELGESVEFKEDGSADLVFCNKLYKIPNENPWKDEDD